MRTVVGEIAERFRRVRNDTPVPYVSASRGSLSQSAGSMAGDVQAAIDAYGSVGTLFAIVSQIINAFATVPWHLYRKSTLRDSSRRPEVTNHGIVTIWNQPNQFMTGRVFRESCQQMLDLVGESIIVLTKVGDIILEMWPVRPDRIVPVKHPTKFLTGWIYLGPNREEIPLTLDQVIQLKYPNPNDPYRGMGPLGSILCDVDAARYAAEWNRNFFINGASPGGIIKVDYRMSDNEFNEMVDRWRNQHQGVANAHRVGILERAEWINVPFSMEDMQFTELRNLPRELIREAYAFPKPMLGTVDDVNRANSDAAKEIMAENQTVPRLNRWKDTFNFMFVPQFVNGGNLELDYENPVPMNREAENAERQSKASAASTLVTAGWDPSDVLETVGLPPMKWVGSGSSTEDGDSGQSTEEPSNRKVVLNAA